VGATRTYTIILEPAEEGGFIVHVPSLPEVSTCGDTEQEALEMAREAIELVLEHRMERGEEIPQEQEPQVRRLTVPVPSAA
jgi:predicted RNase H-like HicB family nuclease